MKMPKIRYILAAVTLAGAAGLWFGRETKSAVADKAVIGLPRTLVAPGRVEAARDPVKLAFESPGRIVEILVDEGDTVTANQVIARLDDRIARLGSPLDDLADFQPRQRVRILHRRESAQPQCEEHVPSPNQPVRSHPIPSPRG